MQKTLYIVGGTMGVGKTAACQALKARLENAVFLDGDWCWDMHPFQVTEETKAMVQRNICFLLNSFLHCSAYEHVIFCWVLHEQALLDSLLAELDTANCRVKVISLICGEAQLRKRLTQDVVRGLRAAEIVERSAACLPLYDRLNTVKLDTSHLTPQETAEAIVKM